jgi:cytochrome c peroxidase
MSHHAVVFGLATLVLAANAVHSQGRVTPQGSAPLQDVPPLLIGTFPHVVVPPGNPMTPEKIQLGKALFFEEQLSSDDTVACATCHLPDAGGGDPRAGVLVRAPGDDGLMRTPDDEFGSFGVVPQDRSGNFEDDPAFGVGRRVTGRNSPSVIAAAFFNTQFWDARAGPVFEDLAGNVVLPKFASLETQAVAPPLSPVEMSHPQRDWDEVTAKLSRARPLALATDLPAELEQFIGDSATYGPLFEQVFGDGTVTRERIAMAIATYERTLIPDQSPFDLGTLTPQQQQGLDVFLRSRCNGCHDTSNGLFSNGSLQTINLPNHQRRVKVPSLRNVGLRQRFMSSGQFPSITIVLQHYQQLGRFVPGPGEVGAVRDFLENGLTDPRVAARLPPFDRPTLRSELAPTGSNLFGVATRGSGQFTPLMLADSPPYLGNPVFKIGLGEALGGTRATLLCSTGRADPGATLLGIPLALDPPFALAKPLLVGRALPGQGVATFRMSLPASAAMLGQKFYAQWFVHDPGAAAGVSATRAAEFELFAPR